jgi:hypothetical protein
VAAGRGPEFRQLSRALAERGIPVEERELAALPLDVELVGGWLAAE